MNLKLAQFCDDPKKISKKSSYPPKICENIRVPPPPPWGENQLILTLNNLAAGMDAGQQIFSKALWAKYLANVLQSSSDFMDKPTTVTNHLQWIQSFLWNRSRQVLKCSWRTVIHLCRSQVKTGEFLPISRGQISAPFPIENSHIFSQYHVCFPN